MTQDRLGEDVGISSKYLSSIERGRENPTLDTLLRLAERLEVEPYDLFLFNSKVDSQEALRREADDLLRETDTEKLHAILTLLRSSGRKHY